jgi:flavin reductase (DIM6/NTAB) family NADH-FMN oxidoreductase RutF
VVFGDVVAIHVEERVLDGTRVDHDALRAVGRMAGSSYVNTRARFELPSG